MMSRMLRSGIIPAILIITLIAALSGCRTPIQDGQVRTPYDRYVVLRGNAKPKKKLVPSPGKQQQQELRERFAPMDRP